MSTFIPKYTPEIEAMHQKLQKATERVVREYQIAIEGLTEKQVAEAFKQAVLAGDFQTNVVAHRPATIPAFNRVTGEWFDIHAQNVTYIPYRQVCELESENARLRKILEDRGIDWRTNISGDET